MKWFVRSIVVLLVLLAVIFGGIIFMGGRMIKAGVNRIGPNVTGVDVTLDHVRFAPLRGFVRLDGLIVGNPEGFQTDRLFNLKTLEVELDVRSLFSDTIRIREILIDSPEITYEMGLRRTNLGTLIDHMTPAESKPEDDDEAKKAGKKVIIDELRIVAARARISTPGMGSKAVPVQLATITLNDLGGEGQSTAQITGHVLKAILGAVGNAALGVGGLVGDGAKAVTGSVEEVGEVALKGAEAVVEVAADGAGAVVGEAAKGVGVAVDVAGDGVKAVGGAAGKGVKKAADAAGEGLRAVGSGVGNLLGLDKDADAQATEEN